MLSERNSLNKTTDIPKVSVIIPVYNTEKYLRECLDSVCNQTLKEIEIICINDGSTDNSLSILNEYAKKDHRITIISQKNSGPSSARNNGIKMAHGLFLSFVDSDDVLDLNFYEELFSTAKKENTLIAKAGLKLIFSNGVEKEDSSNAHIQRLRRKNILPFALFKYPHTTAIFSRDLILKNNIFYPTNFTQGEDTLFLLKLNFKVEKISLVENVFYKYRQNQTSLTHVFSKEYFDGKIASSREILILLDNYEKEDDSYYDYLKSRINFLTNKTWNDLKNSNLDLNYIENCYISILKLLKNVKTIKSFVFFQKQKSPLPKFLSHTITVKENISINPVFEKEIPIVFCSDNHYAKYLCVTIISILKNINSDKNYDILIFDGGIDVFWKSKIQELCIEYKNVFIRFINTDIFREKTKTLHLENYVSTAAYYRLFVASILKFFNKIIYLDCDLVLNSDPALLYDFNLGKYSVAAALDHGIASRNNRWVEEVAAYLASRLKMENPKRYFNSGVLVMNLQKIREDNLESKFLEMAKINNRYMHDQNVLNACLQDDWLELSMKWNFNAQMLPREQFYKNIQEEIEQIINNKTFKIIHYTTRHKPWHHKKGPLSEYFWNYAAEVPWLLKILNRDLIITTIKQLFMTEPVVRFLALFIFNRKKRKRFRARHLI